MLQSVFCRIVLHLRKKNEYEIVKGHLKLQNVQVIKSEKLSLFFTSKTVF